MVVAWHFLWAFDPARIGIVDGFDPSAAMLGSVGFASIDGPAAVDSVLRALGLRPATGLLPGRQHRLLWCAPPPSDGYAWSAPSCSPCCSLICCSAAASTGIARRQSSRSPRGSDTFGGTHQTQDFRPSLTEALLDGSLYAFLRDPDMYNPVLWTMHHEFIGSFVTFFLALLLWRARPMAAVWLLSTAAVVMHFTDPLLIAFVAGTGLAWVMSRFVVQLPLGVALCCVAVGIFLFGYLEPCGSYAGFATLRDPSPISIRSHRDPYRQRRTDYSRPGCQRQAWSVVGKCAFSASRPPVISGVPVPLSAAMLACLWTVRGAAPDIAVPHNHARRRSYVPAAGRCRRLFADPRGRCLAELGQPVRGTVDARRPHVSFTHRRYRAV